MSRHEGVSCDACLRSNFRGRRYKCLVCYDYDLCASCHEAGATTTRHAAEHPMQCILTRSDFDLYFGGELVSSEQPQSLVCPHCGKLGLTELTLADHVTAQHADATTQVVCPVCASVPNGEPNHVTEDLTAHLSVDHGRTASSGAGGGGSRELISFGEEPTSAGSRSAARRVPHPSRSVAGPRMRRFNTHFRESMDPITELLSQLSGVRRSGSTSASSTSSAASAAADAANGSAAALQQLQHHLQMERQQYAQVVRQGTDRARRQTDAPSSSAAPAGPLAAAGAPAARPAAALSGVGAGAGKQGSTTADAANGGSQFLLARIHDDEGEEVDRARRRLDRADRALFVQEIVLSTLSKSLEECAAAAEAPHPTNTPSTSPATTTTTSTSSQTSAETGAPPRPPTTTSTASSHPPGGRVSSGMAAATAHGPRPVGVAARNAALAAGGAGVVNGGRGGVRAVVGVPSGAVAMLGSRVVPVRGRRKPARPPAAPVAADGRGALPAGDPPPPH